MKRLIVLLTIGVMLSGCAEIAGNLIYDIGSGNNYILGSFPHSTATSDAYKCEEWGDDPDTGYTICTEYECMTDACITERTGDIDPADPEEECESYVYDPETKSMKCKGE